MPTGYKNSDGSLSGAAALIKELGTAPPWLVDPSPNKKYGEPEKLELLARLAEGETLAGICRDDHMPARRTIYAWAHSDSEFREAFEHARQLQATSLLDNAMEAADGAKDKDSAMAARVKAETYLKVAALLDPGRYAPKQAGGKALSVVINTNLGGGSGDQAKAEDGAYVITIDGSAGADGDPT